MKLSDGGDWTAFTPICPIYGSGMITTDSSSSRFLDAYKMFLDEEMICVMHFHLLVAAPDQYILDTQCHSESVLAEIEETKRLSWFSMGRKEFPECPWHLLLFPAIETGIARHCTGSFAIRSEINISARCKAPTSEHRRNTCLWSESRKKLVPIMDDLGNVSVRTNRWRGLLRRHHGQKMNEEGKDGGKDGEKKKPFWDMKLNFKWVIGNITWHEKNYLDLT